MNDLPLSLLFGCIFFLIIISGFFSGSETGMLSLNRYRLKHLSKNNHKAAQRALDLLARPERLIGVILIGNNLVNILASAIATVIAIRLFGDAGILIATAALTIVILIFAEITPKTVAALYPERFAFPASAILKVLLKVLYPVVWLINHVTNFLLKMLGLDPNKAHNDQLSSAELRTIVDEAGDLIPDRHQGMLLNILDLETATLEDIMIPRGEMFAIDINSSEESILKQLEECEFTRVPIYKEDIDNIVGILHMRSLGKLLSNSKFSKDALRKIIREPVYAPEGTGLHIQLVNFQKEKRRIAIVVDEYGAIMGLVTLEDILEEIVGEFTSNLTDSNDEFELQSDGAFIVPGSASIRDLNRRTGWKLPVEIDGPKTLNGLIIEHLESIPDAVAAIQIGQYTIEMLEVKDNVVDRARVYAHQEEN